ncbi:MAG: insulinase family protein [Deltaproteobacteria bacterium]
MADTPGKTVLANGLRILTQECPGAPSVSVGAWVDVGSRDEDPAESGISHFVEHMMFKGTNRRTALDIARFLDRIGGCFNAFTSKETTCYHAKVVEDAADQVLELLAEILLQSRFDPDETERERHVILQEIGMVQDTPDDLVHDLHFLSSWPGHGLGRPVLGVPETVSTIRADRLREYVSKTYGPERIVISAAGKVKHDRFVEKVTGLFRDIPTGGQKVCRVKPGFRSGVSITFKELEQVHMILGFAGPSHQDDRRFDASILNVILGGGMSSRLFQEVRERRGLAYSIYSFLSLYHDTGAIGMYAAVSPEKTEETCRILLGELARLAQEPPSVEELDAAKDQLRAGIVLSLENSETHMGHLAKCELRHGGYIPFEEILQRLQDVSAEDVCGLARSCLEQPVFLTLFGPVPGPEVLYQEIIHGVQV